MPAPFGDSLLESVADEQAQVLMSVARQAVSRYLTPSRFYIGQLFTHAEQQRLAASLATTVAVGDLAGRSEILRRTSAVTFEANPVIGSAREALDYFRSLVPVPNDLPVALLPAYERVGFQLAATSDTTLLARVQEAIARHLESNPAAGPAAVAAILDAAGVGPGNDSYAKLVFNTNARTAKMTGKQRELAARTQDYPVWRYTVVDRPTSRPHHLARDGNYYPSVVPFTQIRGTAIEEVAGCLCDMEPVSAEEWAALQERGNGLAYFDESFFATCARDDAGQCLPGSGAKEAPKGKQTKSAPAKPTAHTTRRLDFRTASIAEKKAAVLAALHVTGQTLAEVAKDASKLTEALSAQHDNVNPHSAWVFANVANQLADPDHAQLLPPQKTVTAKQMPNPALAGVKAQTVPASLTTGEKVAQQAYSYGADAAINGALRKGQDVPAEFQAIHERLQSAFGKAATMKSPVACVRGMDLPPEHLASFLSAAVASQQSSEPMALAGYTSTATGSKLAPGFKGNVEVHIQAVQGLDMMPVSHFPQERELLLNNGSQFRVSKVERTSAGVYRVHMEQLPPEARFASPITQGQHAGKALPEVAQQTFLGRLRGAIGFAESYFSICERDDQGYCMDSGVGVDPRARQRPATVAPPSKAQRSGAEHVRHFLATTGREHERLRQALANAESRNAAAEEAYKVAYHASPEHSAPVELETRQQAWIAIEKARDDFYAYVYAAHKALVKVVGVENPVKVEAVVIGFSKSAEEGVHKAIDFARSLTASDKPIAVDVRKTSGRAQYDPLSATVRVGPHAVKTTVHEMGHALENQVPGLRQAAVAFWQKRVGNEHAVPLTVTNPEDGYDAHEYGRSDEFGRAFGKDAAYVGKVYGGSLDGKTHPPSQTEIVSMGLEKLYDDPVGFARADPEYVAFLLDTLAGRNR